MVFFSNCGPFPCLCNNDDSESTKLEIMCKSEIKHSKEKTYWKMMALEEK